MNKHHHKNYSKHIGLKNVIKTEDSVYVTSFGKGNDANIEYRFNVESNKPIEIDNNKTLNIKPVDDNAKGQYAFRLKDTKGVIKNSLNREININRPDYRPQDQTEIHSNKGDVFTNDTISDGYVRLFFKKSHYNDNIHVQIAHNLIDIQKIMALYVMNVINSLMQISRIEDKNSDIVGTLPSFIGYGEYGWNKDEKQTEINKKNVNIKQQTFKKFVNAILPYNYYFDNVLNTAVPNLSEEEVRFGIFQVLSHLRQCVEHQGQQFQRFFRGEIDKECPRYDVAKKIFDDDIEKIKTDVFLHSKNNLNILAEIYNCKDNKSTLDSLFTQYFRIIISKDSMKNLGINFTTIREGLIKKLDEKGTLEPSYKGKINSFIDLQLWMYYNAQDFSGENRYTKDNLERVVQSLRASTSEVEKKKIYEIEINRLWHEENKGNDGNIYKRIFNIVNSTLSSQKLSEFDNEEVLNTAKEHINKEVKGKINCILGKSVEIDDKRLRVSDLAYNIYVLTKFLEKKEVNELLTNIINKLSNISSLIEIAKATSCWAEGGDFKDDKFGILNEWFKDKKSSNKIIGAFGFIKTLGIMNTSLKKEKKTKRKSTNGEQEEKTTGITNKLYIDALNVFLSKGDAIQNDDNDLRFKKIMEMFDSNKGKNKSPRGTEGSKARNFLINNVIKQRRFVYLIKNCDPSLCKAIISNKEIVSFILMQPDMPISIIEKYYQKIVVGKNLDVPKKDMVNELYKALQGISVDSFHDFGRDAMNAKNQNDKEVIKNKELIKLYLTICYLLIKGIVNVNKQFVLAFAAIERDYYNVFKNSINLKDSKTYDAFRLTSKYYNFDGTNEGITNGKKRNREYLLINYNEINPYESDWKELMRRGRNYVAHNNVIGDLNIYISLIKMNVEDDFKYERNRYKKLNDKLSLSPHTFMKSYYGIYMYCLQCYLLSESKKIRKSQTSVSEGNKVNSRRDTFVEWGVKIQGSLDSGTYDKNFSKIMNMPFAYNLARYNNLSIEDLFIDKYPSELLEELENEEKTI